MKRSNTEASNFKTLTRTGSTPKTIVFTVPASARKFEYQQKTYHPALELKGNLVKHNVEGEGNSKTLRKSYTRRLFDLPNSKRITDPTLAPESSLFQGKKNMLKHEYERSQYNPGNINSVISKTNNESNITGCRKASNPKMYKSYNIGEDSYYINTTESVKRELKPASYKIYDNTTQIVALPGGVKRNENDIKDNTKTERNNGLCRTIKLFKDYKSNIVCLGSKDNQEKSLSRESSKKHLGIEKTKATFDIFREYCSTETDSQVSSTHLKIGKKHLVPTQGTFSEKADLSHAQQKMQRPSNIANQFRSQLILS